MERVVIATQAVEYSLLGSSLVLGDVVRFPILGDRLLALGRASDYSRELFACGLRTKVEARTLDSLQLRYIQRVRTPHK